VAKDAVSRNTPVNIGLLIRSADSDEPSLARDLRMGGHAVSVHLSVLILAELIILICNK
jgi:hypothetical protein